MAENFPHSMPTGWFAVAPETATSAGECRSLHFFERDLVLWREAGGEAHLMDAYCPHLGAHLGHGGSVEGDTIRCPFHGWAFRGDGRCQSIPYAKRVPAGVELASWPIVERNGFIWAWYDPTGRAPWYDLPDLEEFEDDTWREVHRRTWVVRTQIQEMAENGVDGPHFQTVHGATALPASDIQVDGPTRVAVQKAPLETSRGSALSVITVRQIGLGFSYTRFTGLCETTSLNVVTPIDRHQLEFTVVFLQPARQEDEPASGITRAIIEDLEKQIAEDIPIWEHKVYRERPMLCDGDGPIPEFRRWCRQFDVPTPKGPPP